MTSKNKMSDYAEWQPIATAPRDGKDFLGGNEITGNVYPTHYHPRWETTKEVEEGDITKAWLWWTKDSSGRETSFAPTHWRRD